MRGREFLAFAESIGTLLPGSAGFRSGTSRAYYGAYLEARSSCELYLNFERAKARSEHGEVLRIVARLNEDIAASLRFLRQFRNAAVYDLDLSGEAEEFQYRRSLIEATRIIAFLDAIILELECRTSDYRASPPTDPQ